MKFKRLPAQIKPKTTFGSIPIGSTFRLAITGDPFEIFIKTETALVSNNFSQNQYDQNCVNLKNGLHYFVGNDVEVKIIHGVFEYKEIE